MRLALGAIILMGVTAVAGCSDRGLRDLRTNSAGPEEFMVMPVKPLTAPSDYKALPTPTPGGANLVDQYPRADAVDALGGNPAALATQGVPASDGALVTQASRYGVPANTRVALAEEDAEFRKRQARWSSFKLFPVDRYEQAYRRQSLNPFSANQAFRRSGYETPTAPPEGE